ncbi:MAG: chromophore lyase CpcT/CpeT [Steroidobacteraceae bacterium]
MARITVLLAVGVALALTAGCAGQRKRAQADLVELGTWLPGYYDNQAQVRVDQQAGRAPHEALTLTVVPIDAELVGARVYYVEEAAGGDPRHVTMQRLASFAVTKTGIVESLWTFTDPTRWLGAASTPELFTALQPGDVRRMEGCDLKWTRAGTRFTAANDPSECRIELPGTRRVEALDMRVQLGANELAISAHPEGMPAAQAAPGGDPYIRFRRNGGPS